jgi:hypothetical protein
METVRTRQARVAGSRTSRVVLGILAMGTRTGRQRPVYMAARLPRRIVSNHPSCSPRGESTPSRPRKKVDGDGQRSSDEVQRWTTKRRTALVLSILNGETSVQQAARHGLTVAELEDWQERFLRAHQAPTAGHTWRPSSIAMIGNRGRRVRSPGPGQGGRTGTRGGLLGAPRHAAPHRSDACHAPTIGSSTRAAARKKQIPRISAILSVSKLDTIRWYHSRFPSGQAGADPPPALLVC